MSIFRRANKNAAEPSPESADIAAGADDPTLADATDGADTAATEVPVAAAPSRAAGPFDRSEVDDAEGRLDLGSLWLAGVPGMELRLEVDQEAQTVVGVTAVLGESAVQLQAFAAPRSEGIWEDIRSEIAASITRQGGTAEDAAGPLGTELQTRMPGQDAAGRTIFSPARFLGVDGPRWFLRAVLTRPCGDRPEAGRAADRRRPLDRRGPRRRADGPARPAAAAAAGDRRGPARRPTRTPTPERSTDDLSPFERGPEITEIR